MVNHDHNFIFIHIPKTGGVSIEECLPAGIYPNHHLSLSEYKAKEGIDLSKYFKFSFVRNPWDRMVSVYFFWLSQGVSHPFYQWDYKQALYLQKNEISFKKFIREVGEDRPIFRREHLRSHAVYARGLDFIGRFENLQEDFDVACDKIKISQRKLPHANKSKHEPYAEYYDDETRQIVAEKYAQDIEVFGYKFK